MTRVKYLGQGVSAFSVPCPSGARYPIEPVTSLVIEVLDSDADWLLTDQPELWAKEEVDAPEPPAEAVTEEDAAPSPKKKRG